jgi:hypothetical protein
MFVTSVHNKSYKHNQAQHQKKRVNMDLLNTTLIIIGLALFETVNSIDNAIINADVLAGVNRKTRKFFLTWGLFSAVFLVRGVLPWLIVWAAIPAIGLIGALTHTFSTDPNISEAISSYSPVLLVGAATFLLCLFLHWFLVEIRDKKENGLKFYLSVPVALAVIFYFSAGISYDMITGTLIGGTGFFIMQGLKEHAEKKRQKIIRNGMTDYSKVIYLEMIDASFSIDGVLGAFAFTLSVPLIIIGNGIGALIVRSLTLGNLRTIHKYKLIKNGAMYSILMLSMIMLLNSFGIHIPIWVAPIITIMIVAYFAHKAIRLNRQTAATIKSAN